MQFSKNWPGIGLEILDLSLHVICCLAKLELLSILIVAHIPAILSNTMYPPATYAAAKSACEHDGKQLLTIKNQRKEDKIDTVYTGR